MDIVNAKSLIGTWTLLTRVEVTSDGHRRIDPILGPDPIAYLIYDAAGHFAVQFMIAEGSGDTVTARLRPVELGTAYGNQIAITKGVAAGDRVITTGVTLVKNGDTVQVVP